jgi:RND family efflux transporter MFP subunit
VEPRNLVPARARIGGTVTQLEVTEGNTIEAGTRIAVVEDEKLAFRLESIDAQLGALRSQLDTAQSELTRGESLRERGVITVQRLEQLQSAVDVLQNQIKSAEADRLGVQQQVAEGEVLSPVSGVVLSVPVTKGSYIAGGETVAQVGGGGVFLRLSLPERHAENLVVGDDIIVGTTTEKTGESGKLVKVYPLIEGGRVMADVEVADLDDRFVGLRVPVRLPVGKHDALLVPEAAVSRDAGLDFVTVMDRGNEVRRTVVPGSTVTRDGAQWVEILTGLQSGDKVVTPDE